MIILCLYVKVSIPNKFFIFPHFKNVLNDLVSFSHIIQMQRFILHEMLLPARFFFFFYETEMYQTHSKPI